MNHAVHSAAAQELVVLLVDQHADRQLVDGRHLDWRGGGQFDASEAGGRGTGEGCGGFEEIAAVEQQRHGERSGMARGGRKAAMRYWAYLNRISRYLRTPSRALVRAVTMLRGFHETAS